METKDIKDLRANPRNPRQLSKHDYESLKRAILKFGDLGGIVFNTRTQQLVGGHQRIEAFKSFGDLVHIEITQRYEQPTKVGTIAIGKVLFGGEQFSYREVDWPIEHELAANIAANRISGEFDIDLLGEITYELSQLENGANLLEATGQREEEIERLLKMNGAINDDPPAEKDDKLSFKVTAEQRQIIEEALRQIRINNNVAGDDVDELNGQSLYLLSKKYLIEHEQPIVAQPQ